MVPSSRPRDSGSALAPQVLFLEPGEDDEAHGAEGMARDWSSIEVTVDRDRPTPSEPCPSIAASDNNRKLLCFARHQANEMLTEMEVINAVERYLHGRGFVTREKVPTVQSRGHDLVMESRSGALLIVEAKGQSSSQPHTAHFGQEYSRNQKETHLGRAILSMTWTLSQGHSSAVALPGDWVDEQLVNDRKAALERLGLVVFLVRPDDGNVRVEVGALPV
jgi:hypothetical protein